MDAVRTEGLTKYYGRARGIVDVSLSVEQGEFFGFIGPNGAGKSTFIRILLGMLAPSGGTASVLGMDVTKERERILRSVGYLPAEAFFYAGMRVRDVLRLSAELRGKETAARCGKQADILCERLRLDAGRRVEELSFGNRKKIAIVCALQHEPSLLILDEPTSGLDPLIQREFFTILGERSRAGATVFLSSHILSEIRNNCSRAAIIRQGRVIACDSVDRLADTGVKRVQVHGEFADRTPGQLAGVRDLVQTEDGRGYAFLYSGDINALLHLLSACSIRDLTIAEPDPEEVFMHYYTDSGTENAVGAGGNRI